MTSDAKYTQAFVWVWLKDQTEPVVASLLSASGKQLVFNYGRSYLARKDAIPLYEPELPLRAGPSDADHGPGACKPNCAVAESGAAVSDGQLGSNPARDQTG